MTARLYKLAFIGFGTVGQGALELMHTQRDYLRDAHGLTTQVVGVFTGRHGALVDPNGLDVESLLTLSGQGKLSEYPGSPSLARNWDALRVIRESGADVVIEVSPTNIETAEPALSHFRTALESGKHLITANKGPLALHFKAMNTLAHDRGVFFGYEGTVMGGTPVLRMARDSMAGCAIPSIRGIVNSTTNYILTKMESGLSYAEALKLAQQGGFAETDPRGDVEGFDAAAKITILANAVMGADLTPDAVQRTGITQIGAADIAAAQSAGERWKLIASAERTADGTVHLRVAPERLPFADPLAQVNDTLNAITFATDHLGPVTLIGSGAGRFGTGFAIFSDLIQLNREHH